MNTDPIADLLTRIRNAYMAKRMSTNAPYSKVKEQILNVLKKYEFIDTFSVEGDGVNKKLMIDLAYDEEGKPMVNSIKRMSKPSLRKYVKAKDITSVRGGFGIGIYSTSKGIMSDRDARNAGLGGEFVAKVW